jgi:hypothetical protein
LGIISESRKVNQWQSGVVDGNFDELTAGEVLLGGAQLKIALNCVRDDEGKPYRWFGR